MSALGTAVLVTSLAALGLLVLFIRRCWRNRKAETWPKREAVWGLVEVGIFLYCVLTLVFLGLGSLIGLL